MNERERERELRDKRRRARELKKDMDFLLAEPEMPRTRQQTQDDANVKRIEKAVQAFEKVRVVDIEEAGEHARARRLLDAVSVFVARELAYDEAHR